MLTWTMAVGCFGQVGWGPQGKPSGNDAGPAPDGASKPPIPGKGKTPDAGPTTTDTAPDASGSDQIADQPGQDQSGSTDQPGSCPPIKYDPIPAEVYYKDMQSFLQAFCVNCHGASSKTGDILIYHSATRGRTPVDFWGHALQRIKSTTQPMPPDGPQPRTCDNMERFQNGVKWFEAWAKAGFPEKPGGSTTPTKVDPSVKNFPQQNTCQGKEPLPARLWRLSNRQLRYVLLDVFGSKTTLPKHTLVFQHNDGFDNNANASLITGVDMVHMLQWLDPFSKSVISTTTEFRSCINASGTSCVKQLINKYGKRLWRRPVQTDELNKILNTFTTLAQSHDRNTGMEAVIERMIMSPQALYRSEIGTAVAGQPGVRRLTPYEVASFLSFTIWNSVPDDALLTAAANDQLGSLAEVRAQMSRMMKLPAAQRGVFEFLYDWLHLDKLDDDAITKSSSLFPQYTPALRQSLLKENQLLIADVVWKRMGTLAELFTTNQTFANADIAKLYGMSVSGSQFTPLSTSSNERAGIMTTPGFMAAHGKATSTGIVHRGLYVLIHMLCQTVGDPPAGATEAGNDKLKGKDQSKMTDREILELKTSTGTCKNCHSEINPAGYAFENYDPIGRFRTVEKGSLPIDSSGTSALVSQAAPGFKNGLEFIKKLAGSTVFRQCFSLKMYDYFLGTRPKADQSCGVASLHSTMKGSQFQLSKSYEALLSMPNFFLRKEQPTTQP